MKLRHLIVLASFLSLSINESSAAGRIERLQNFLGPGQKVIEFTRGEAGKQIRNLHSMATQFVPGVRNKGLIHLDPRDNDYLKKIFGVDYRMVGRYMGNISNKGDLNLTVLTRNKYWAAAEIGFGPRFPGIGVDESGDVYVLLEYLQGSQLAQYSGNSVSRGIVEAIDNGVVNLARNKNIMVLDAHPNNLMIRPLQNHPKGFKAGAWAYDFDVMPYDALDSIKGNWRLAYEVRNTLSSRYHAMKYIRRRLGSDTEWGQWPDFYLDVMKRVDWDGFKSLRTFND